MNFLKLSICWYGHKCMPVDKVKEKQNPEEPRTIIILKKWVCESLEAGFPRGM